MEPGGPTIARVHDGDVHPRVTVEPCFDRLCRIAYPLCDAAHDIVAAGDLQPCGVATRAVLRKLEPVIAVVTVVVVLGSSIFRISTASRAQSNRVWPSSEALRICKEEGKRRKLERLEGSRLE